MNIRIDMIFLFLTISLSSIYSSQAVSSKDYWMESDSYLTDNNELFPAISSPSWTPLFPEEDSELSTATQEDDGWLKILSGNADNALKVPVGNGYEIVIVALSAYFLYKLRRRIMTKK